MRSTTPRVVTALVAAGVLWGTTVPLTKVAGEAFGAWELTALRFGFAAAVLLLVTPARQVREALHPSVLLAGAGGYGIVVVLQNAGVARTSVAHAALLIGAIPLIVAAVDRVLGRPIARTAGAGVLLGSLGIALVALGSDGGDVTLLGDGLVLLSVLLSAGFLMLQPRLLRGRSPVAVTAVQFAAAAGCAAVGALLLEGAPSLPGRDAELLVLAGLVLGGTLLPFTLFAVAQARVTPAAAAAFLNLEPLVGAVLGWSVFADPASPTQLAGAGAIFVGLALHVLGTTAGTSGSTRPSDSGGRARPDPDRVRA